jgi:hypothetical protein
MKENDDNITKMRGWNTFVIMERKGQPGVRASLVLLAGRAAPADANGDGVLDPKSGQALQHQSERRADCIDASMTRT